MIEVEQWKERAMVEKSPFPGDRDRAKSAIAEILRYLGEDESREGLRMTPERVVRSWDSLFGGMFEDPRDVLTTFEEKEAIPYDQIIVLKDIEFFSICEHHLLPFMGRAHVAYIPSDKIVGISKLARILDIYARRLQLQERIGNQVTSCLMKYLEPKGSACILKAKHFCMICRGVKKQNSEMVTSSLKGCFLDNAQTRHELMALISG